MKVLVVICCCFHMARVNEGGGDGTAADAGRLGAALPSGHTVSGGGVADGGTGGTALVLIAT